MKNLKLAGYVPCCMENLESVKIKTGGLTPSLLSGKLEVGII
jgi:hypothetical protein